MAGCLVHLQGLQSSPPPAPRRPLHPLSCWLALPPTQYSYALMVSGGRPEWEQRDAQRGRLKEWFKQQELAAMHTGSWWGAAKLEALPGSSK